MEKVRFKGTTGSGQTTSQYRGDLAIDYVTILTDTPPLPPVKWLESASNAHDIHYAQGNVGIGTEEPNADLSILGNLSKPLSGHVGVNAGFKHVTGVDTRFTEELMVGDSPLIGEEVFIVIEILGDAELIIDVAHTVGEVNATAYTDSDLLSVRAGAETEALVVYQLQMRFRFRNAL